MADERRAVDGRHAVGEPRAAGESTRTREYHWPGAFNARDLGGIEVAAGVLRAGALFRSGKPEAWEAAGFEQAAADGVRRILDLRDPSEPGGAPSGASNVGIDYLFSPIEDPHDPEFKLRFQPYLNHTSGYRDFLAMFGDRIARSVETVLTGGPGTLFCCSAGRDRTGLVCSILLLSLGAEVEELLRQDEVAVRAINERHRGREHPHESWHSEEIVAEMVASRRTALIDFADEFDAHAFLRDHGVASRVIENAGEWLVPS